MPLADSAQSGGRRLWWIVCLVGVASVGIAIWLLAFKGRTSSANQSEQAQSKSGGPTNIEIIHPQPGGIDRVSIQPGTVEPFESADLYAKVSGFLLETVDIGTKVKKNDVLARISVPEYEKQVKKDQATVEHTRARVEQMKAHLEAAKAEAKAAQQMIAQVKIELRSKSFYQSYRFKLLERIKLLEKDEAIEAKVVDEDTDRYEAAVEAVNAAKEAVTTSELKWEAAKAKVEQARADIDDAKAEVDVADAELERAKVLLDYTIIKSPYDGVVTKRNFNRGDFIRSADAGGDRFPIVAVDRTDLMRIVVQIPDRDVPYVDVGDAATFEIVALPGKLFNGTIARKASAEDAQTRMMRTEIDIPNTDGSLLRNMYGQVKLTLQVGAATALRIPSAALVNKSEGEHASVRVLRDHRVHLVSVAIGIDTGVEVEILSGLKASDLVILRANGPLEEGTEVVDTHAISVETPH